MHDKASMQRLYCLFNSSPILPNSVSAPIHDSGFLGAFIYTEHCRDHGTRHYTRLQGVDHLINSLLVASFSAVKQCDQHNLKIQTLGIDAWDQLHSGRTIEQQRPCPAVSTIEIFLD